MDKDFLRYAIGVTLHVSVWVEMKNQQKLKATWTSHAPRERVSWNSFLYSILFRQKVTLHVSVWVEIDLKCSLMLSGMSRSTWACELKFPATPFNVVLSCHAPRERVSWNECYKFQQLIFCSHAPRERVSWNILIYKICRIVIRHAPRERVSWNAKLDLTCSYPYVTLHVSVWVEIFVSVTRLFLSIVTLHVSVWVEMKFFFVCVPQKIVTLHVSVWVEMRIFAPKSSQSTCHAPRERVSWNHTFFELHFQRICHAPRERVSWNLRYRRERQGYCVTLHVSVWVEIKTEPYSQLSLMSRSTWACELKFQPSALRCMPCCHAPRERVSWNALASW